LKIHILLSAALKANNGSRNKATRTEFTVRFIRMEFRSCYDDDDDETTSKEQW